ncbi:hypothetical protein CCMSSC00406_0005714 [Pleurotus cornucopiae]|uniref:Uncharacterized protein n=1 Tax=Pleurotus cornucopiae TaxID=5321 RepID=A0ACB7IWG1_PLECO|nr:hypothetical protein CCMSSC00406_0005714 [Pleurotus cornucopiae]
MFSEKSSPSTIMKVSSNALGLTPEQRRMYATEKMMNFRRISKIMATRSPYILSSKDLASPELHVELSELGQFAEIVYSAVPVEVIFSMLDRLVQPLFPLEGYSAVANSKLLSAFKGKVANLPGYVAYRPETKQLILAFSGTSSFMHALHDLRTLTHRHKSGRGAVHSGFWGLYKGIKASAIEAVRKALESEDVDEIVVTGHSMGGAVSCLLMLDILRDDTVFDRPTVPLKLVTFGPPRCGDSKMGEYWRELTALRHSKYGENSFKEYLVKGYNDGVPSLPPYSIGYRHFTPNPLYFLWGHLYHIPPSESEHTLFDLQQEDAAENYLLDHPRGGHNYYSGRDLEKFVRRMRWLDNAMSGDGDWESRYKKHVRKHEQ